MSVVFTKDTDSFVAFPWACKHTTDSVSPRGAAAAAQRGAREVSVSSLSQRSRCGPSAVVGVVTGH